MIRLEEIKIGQRVRDNVTGLEGVITGYVDHISGYRQFVVQAPHKDGEMKDAFAHDWQAFEILDNELVENVISPEEHPFNLGDEVEAIDIKMKGVISRFWTYINGCVHATLALPADKEGRSQDSMMVPVTRIKRTGKRVIATPAKPTSGPPTRAPRM